MVPERTIAHEGSGSVRLTKPHKALQEIFQGKYATLPNRQMLLLASENRASAFVRQLYGKSYSPAFLSQYSESLIFPQPLQSAPGSLLSVAEKEVILSVRSQIRGFSASNPAARAVQERTATCKKGGLGVSWLPMAAKAGECRYSQLD
jgi:hypothetical protein